MTTEGGPRQIEIPVSLNVNQKDISVIRRALKNTADDADRLGKILDQAARVASFLPSIPKVSGEFGATITGAGKSAANLSAGLGSARASIGAANVHAKNLKESVATTSFSIGNAAQSASTLERTTRSTRGSTRAMQRDYQAMRIETAGIEKPLRQISRSSRSVSDTARNINTTLRLGTKGVTDINKAYERLTGTQTKIGVATASHLASAENLQPLADLLNRKLGNENTTREKLVKTEERQAGIQGLITKRAEETTKNILESVTQSQFFQDNIFNTVGHAQRLSQVTAAVQSSGEQLLGVVTVIAARFFLVARAAISIFAAVKATNLVLGIMAGLTERVRNAAKDAAGLIAETLSSPLNTQQLQSLGIQAQVIGLGDVSQLNDLLREGLTNLARTQEFARNNVDTLLPIADIFKQIGLNVSEFSELLATDTLGAIRQLDAAAQQLTFAERITLYTELFGEASGKTAQQLARYSKATLDSANATAELLHVLSAEELAALQKFREETTIMELSQKALSDTFSSILIPSVSFYNQLITTITLRTTSWLTQNKGLARFLITAGVTALIAFSIALIAMSVQLVISTGLLGVFAGFLWAALLPLLPFIAAGIALVAVAALIIVNWQKVVFWFKVGLAIIQDLWAWFDRGPGRIILLVTPLGRLILVLQFLIANFDKVRTVGSRVFQEIAKPIERVVKFLQLALRFLSLIGQTTAKFFGIDKVDSNVGQAFQAERDRQANVQGDTSSRVGALSAAPAFRLTPAGSSNTRVDISNTYEISGTGDPEETARLIAEKQAFELASVTP